MSMVLTNEYRCLSSKGLMQRCCITSKLHHFDRTSRRSEAGGNKRVDFLFFIIRVIVTWDG